MNFKGFTLGIIISGLMLPFLSSGQDLRKQIMGAQRKVMKEVKRTKRDAKKVGKMFGSSKKTVDSSSDTADIITWSKAPYIPNSGMIHDYEYIYTSSYRKNISKISPISRSYFKFKEMFIFIYFTCKGKTLFFCT